MTKFSWLAASLMLAAHANLPAACHADTEPTATQAVAESSVVATEEESEEGFISLFNGQSLAGWMGAAKGYVAEDGVLRCTKECRGNLLTKREFGDFILRFEFKLTPGANNGIGLRAPDHGDPAYVGFESQVLDNTAKVYENLQPYQYHGSLYGVAAAKRGMLRPVGEWNEQEIHFSGRDVRITLNDEVILDVNLDKVAPEGKTVDGKKHPGLDRKKGHICLLSHGHEVDFRNLRVKELPADSDR